MRAIDSFGRIQLAVDSVRISSAAPSALLTSNELRQRVGS
jgi:hypothetical protein